MQRIDGLARAEFEIMNFKMAGIQKIIKYMRTEYPELKRRYQRLMQDKDFYAETINKLKIDIREAAKKHFKTVKIHAHAFDEYFANRY